MGCVCGSCRVGSSTLRKTEIQVGQNTVCPPWGFPRAESGRHRGTGGSEWVRESEPRGVPGPASLGVLAFFSFEEARFSLMSLFIFCWLGHLHGGGLKRVLGASSCI